MVIVPLVSIFAVAILFRFLWLETIPGLNGDEAWLGWKASKATQGVSLDWRTNTGNFTNPFFLLPLVGLHYLVEPSAWVIRSVSAVSGVITIILNFVFCRRVLGNEAAWASSLLLTVLPITIAYSRFGWEPSQTPLFSVLIVFSALGIADSSRLVLPWILLSGASLFCGFLVHPTMVFLALFPALALLARLIQPEAGFYQLVIFIFTGAVSAVSLGFVMVWRAPHWVAIEILSRFEGGVWLWDLPRFFVAWLRNFNGVNIFGNLPSSWPGAAAILNKSEPWPLFAIDFVALVLFVVAFLLIGQRVFFHSFPSRPLEKEKENGRPQFIDILPRMQDRFALVLVAAFTLGSLLFGILNGTAKAAVWFDRYGLWSVVPGCMILGMGYSSAVHLFPKMINLLRITGAVLAIAMLFLFWSNYLNFFASKGGESFWLGSRVGERQPAAMAAEKLQLWDSDEVLEGRRVLLSSDWFVFWPIAYYQQRFGTNARWEMVYAGPESPQPLRGENQLNEHFMDCLIAVVEFDGASAWDNWEDVFIKKYWGNDSKILNDIAGRSLLRIQILDLKNQND